MSHHPTYILGGGVTGLAAGYASGLPMLEAAEAPGGICSSYYVRPGQTRRHATPPADGECYRFEIGGGHWIFGGDPVILRFIRSLEPMKSYARVSSVFFAKTGRYVPYPLQNHLRALDPAIASKALSEMAKPRPSFTTMKEWLVASFGQTLSDLFFMPFHERYTAGCHETIAPQDAYKSPVDLSLAIQGAFDQVQAVGYNTTFLYPINGLNALAQKMAQKCDIRYGHRVTKIDVAAHELVLADGRRLPYGQLVGTLPLNHMLTMAGLKTTARTDPYTSVLVLNIGATRGPNCPADHWLYNPDSKTPFHRVGFYSNVDRSFVPRSAQQNANCVSIYVERAYPGGQQPSPEEVAEYSRQTVAELKAWGYIGEAEVVDPTWIDVAYTWSWPGSQWVREAMRLLEKHDVYPVGRYARWNFQGIADSVRDGLIAGGAFAEDGFPARRESAELVQEASR